WLRGGFEMDRRGNWRLKPQVADTLERDVTAIIAQTGWQRSLSRNADHQTSNTESVSGDLSATASRGVSSGGKAKDKGKDDNSGSSGNAVGSLSGKVGMDISDRGAATVSAQSSMDIVNYDVREVIASAEKAAARSGRPEETFAKGLSDGVLGNQGLRNRYLEQADSGRGTMQLTAPLTSMEQSSILSSGRLLMDRDHGPADGDPTFKERRDP
ncbi:conjugal transfer protein TraG, partial [Sphingobium yanoikuyae]|nr:conjugal transfer protein TraG [Sphingobium yanoikuyae]